MKLFPRFFLEGEGGGSGGGGGTLLGGGSSSAPPPAQQQQQHAQDDGASKGTFDFRTLLDDTGNFRQGWDSSLPDDLKPHVGALSKYPNPLELMRGHANASKLIGAKTALTPPAADAKPEEVTKYNEAVRAALGVPAKAEDYKLTAPTGLPEGVTVDEGQMKEFTALAHSLNIPPAAAQKLMEFDAKRMATLQQGGQAKLDEFVKSQGDILQKEWGDKMGENISRAKRAAELLGLDINDPQLGNNAAFIKAMHTASGLMKDDKLIGSEGATAGTGGAAQAEDIRRNKDNPWHAAYMGKEGKARQTEAAALIARLQGQKV